MIQELENSFHILFFRPSYEGYNRKPFQIKHFYLKTVKKTNSDF